MSFVISQKASSSQEVPKGQFKNARVPADLVAPVLAMIPTAVLVLVFAVVLAGHTHRTFSRVTEPGVFENFNRGFVDFHNAVHFPTKSFLNGKNPYSRQYVANHPDKRTFPLFPPQSLIVHIPFGIGGIEVSRVLYCVFELAIAAVLLLLIQWIVERQVTLRFFLYLGIALMLTVPFYTSYYMGQLTLQLVLGTVVAVHYSKTQPMLAAFGLALAACKPQFGIPLAILLLCRRDWKTALGGGFISVVVSGAAVVVICSNFGWQNFVDEIKTVYLGLDSHPDVGTALDNGWRLDIYPVLARFLTVDGQMPTWSKFVAPAVYLAVGGLGVFWLRNRSDARPLSNMIICLTCLGCIYHSVYDAILLLWPLAALGYGRSELWEEVHGAIRWALLLLLMAIMVNVFHLEGTQRAFGIFDSDLFSWRLVTSLGPLAVLTAMLVSVGLALRIGSGSLAKSNPGYLMRWRF